MSGSLRVLVTGAAGFGGSHLSRALLARGYGVTGLDVAAPAQAWRLAGELGHPDFRYVWKSVQDVQPGDVAGHFAVAHLAAQADAPLAFESPRYTAMQNIDGTVALLEATRQAGGVDKVLFAASGNETGRALYLPIDEHHPLTPHNPYGFSEAPADQVAGQKFYIAGGQEHSIEELALMCRDASGGDVAIEYADYRPGEKGQREAFSIDKSRRVLGYAPRVAAAEAVGLTARWVAGLPLDGAGV